MTMDLRPYIDKFARRLAEVESALSDPSAFDHKQRAQELSKEYSRLKELVATGAAYLKTQADLAENRSLLETEPAASELAALAREEVARLEAAEKKLTLEVQRGVLPPDPTDSRNTIIEIRAGAGGDDGAGFSGRRPVENQNIKHLQRLQGGIRDFRSLVCYLHRIKMERNLGAADRGIRGPARPQRSRGRRARNGRSKPAQSPEPSSGEFAWRKKGHRLHRRGEAVGWKPQSGWASM